MKAQDLRLGNWVLFLGNAKRVTIVDLEIIVNRLETDKTFEPITLTEEWLLKFGAELFRWGWVINEKFLIKWDRKDKFWVELGNGRIIVLPYVHTLQNFFALTGEELKIKP